MKRFTAYWEVVDEDGNWIDSDSATFDTYSDSILWLGDRITDTQFYCTIADNERKGQCCFVSPCN